MYMYVYMLAVLWSFPDRWFSCGKKIDHLSMRESITVKQEVAMATLILSLPDKNNDIAWK